MRWRAGYLAGSFRETHESIHGAWFRCERRVIGAHWLTNSRKKPARYPENIVSCVLCKGGRQGREASGGCPRSSSISATSGGM